jgi:hypothetical protein
VAEHTRTGSLGGAIGVGAAYPFDTLKTKAQTFEVEDDRAWQAQGTVTVLYVYTYI